MNSFELETLVESHLNLQVKISYAEHSNFLVRNHLSQCTHVLDVGCGNGTFVARLAQDYPMIEFVGIDKRKQCVESCQKINQKNLVVRQVDMFSRQNTFDFSIFDGFLMRYFLLHVDHAQKILELFKLKARSPSRFWIIDLDWSQFSCEPKHESFDKLTSLVKDFCTKISVETMGGQKVASLMHKLGYKNIHIENLPFSARNIPLQEFVLYLIQEVQCYSRMSGRAINDPDTKEILRFIDEEVRLGKFQISYGMILLSAEL